MSVLPDDIEFYGSANMPEDDTGTAGGAIDTSIKVSFTNIAPTGNVQIVSSSGSDTVPTVTVTGRNAAGAQIAETKTLNGQTPVAMTTQTSWERLLKATKAATTAGTIAVEEATAERANTAQGGAAKTVSEMAYITLDAAASAVDDAYNGMVLRLTGGTGVGQIREIVDYRGSDKRAWVKGDWGTPPDGTTTFRVAQGMVFEKTPNEIDEVRSVFFAVSADVAGGSDRDFYTKIFARNNHATLALTAAVISEDSDPSGLIDFGLVATLDDSGTATNRVTAPAAITFNSTAKNVANSQVHSPVSAQGIWLHLDLNAGQAAQKTTYRLREAGSST